MMRDKEIYEALARLSQEPLYIKLRAEGALTGMILIPDDPFVGEGLACIDLFQGTSYRPNRVAKVMMRLDEPIEALYKRLLTHMAWLAEPLLIDNKSIEEEYEPRPSN
jgi:hypothetical protein